MTSPAPLGQECRRSFLLVHGAWHGGWCWERVAERLRAAGHRVYAPTLSGLAERAHLPTEKITLTTHIDEIVALIDEQHLADLVLSGHSYGGMVVSGVAERREQSIRAIVFVDAFLPSDGDSIASLTPIGLVLPELIASGATALPPVSAEAFGVNMADRGWVDAQCTDQPLGTFSEGVAIKGAREWISSKVYVRASGYAAPWFDDALLAAMADPTWRTESLSCGHDAMIDCPDAVAAILEAA